MQVIPISLIILLTFASSLWGQPWQWERFEGDLYNPTGFPASGSSNAFTVGDFDGDGTDEYLEVSSGGFLMARKDSGRFHWTVESFSQPLGVGFLCPLDADSDGADELIVEGDPNRLWKLTSTDPWIWTEREDLEADFIFSTGWSEIIFGDYDSDGLVNAVLTFGDASPEIMLYERNPQHVWVLDSTLQTDGGQIRGIFDGDFDHDGDKDFAVAPQISDIPPYYAFGENTPEGLVVHSGNDWSVSALSGPTGGDLDGDGEWEGLFRSNYFAGLSLVETAAAPPPVYIEATSSRYLGPAPGLPFANFRTDTGRVLVAARTYRYGDPFQLVGAFDLWAYTPEGWVPYFNGFYEQMGNELSRADLGDAGGDGLADILTAEVHHEFNQDTWSWVLWRNVGTATSDQFSLLSRVRVDDHLPGLPNCYADTPQLGDITGDGRAELAAVPHRDQSPARIIFYEMLGDIEDTTFVRHDEWSDGLPDSVLQLRLIDLDNDGLSEAVCKVSGDWEHGHWDVFFRRGGAWIGYDNILPALDAPDVSFADADNDGDLDLFTPTEVWLNLSPSKTDRPLVYSPSSFTLSAFPNPFNPTAEITFTLPKAERASVKVFDILGQQVSVLRDGMLRAGEHRVVFDGGLLPAGIYFLRLEAAAHQKTLKLVLLK